MWLLIKNIHEKFRDDSAEERHGYHATREKLRYQLRHPGRGLDLKAKDLIGHIWVFVIIDQSECLICYLFLHWINTFLHRLKKTALLLTNQNGEIFSCILLGIKWNKLVRVTFVPWRENETDFSNVNSFWRRKLGALKCFFVEHRVPWKVKTRVGGRGGLLWQK